MIEYTFPVLLPLAGRLHGWGGLKGCKLIAKVMLGSAYAYAVYDCTGNVQDTAVSGVVAALGFSLAHRQGFFDRSQFLIKGAIIASMAAYYMQSPVVLLSSMIGWFLSYEIAKRVVGYDKTQEGKFFATKVWTFWGETVSLFVASLGLIWG